MKWSALLLSLSVARADNSVPQPATGDAPEVLIREWKKAENRRTCAPIWSPAVTGGKLRRASFSGGWAVAIDKKGERSVMGIAGAGVEGAPENLEKWPYHKQIAGGIRAGYGLEGINLGPGWLAYVLVPGQGCLYNVWSHVSREDLEKILDGLRVVHVE